MGIIEIILTAIGLAMDAFAVSICRGLKMKKLRYGQTAVIALLFGGFQALMPLIGYLLGINFQSYIEPVDHWIAFALLAFIGGKMLLDAFKKDDEDECACCDGGEKLNFKELVVMAIATSIDALAVGITMSCLELEIHIASALSLIGAITFVICFGGVIIGHVFGAKFKDKAQIAGGAILILIGLKILLEHLGVLAL